MLTEPWFNQEEEPIEWQDATFTNSYATFPSIPQTSLYDEIAVGGA